MWTHRADSNDGGTIAAGWHLMADTRKRRRGRSDDASPALMHEKQHLVVSSERTVALSDTRRKCLPWRCLGLRDWACQDNDLTGSWTILNLSYRLSYSELGLGKHSTLEGNFPGRDVLQTASLIPPLRSRNVQVSVSILPNASSTLIGYRLHPTCIRQGVGSIFDGLNVSPHSRMTGSGRA